MSELTKILLGFGGMISCTVVANVLLKLGADSAVEQKWLFGFLGWKSIAGFAVFALSAMIYAWVLQWLPLNVAQSFLSAQFVAVVIASAFFLHEPISAVRWFGIFLIASGILTVALTHK